MATQVRTLSQVQAALDRALAKSDEQARAGNLPRLIRQAGVHQTWSVASRTSGGTVYLIDVHHGHGGADMQCSCVATGHCWHREHVERALAGMLEFVVVPEMARTSTPPQCCTRCHLYSSGVLLNAAGLCTDCAAATAPEPEPVGCRDCGQVLPADATDPICRDCWLFGRP